MTTKKRAYIKKRTRQNFFVEKGQLNLTKRTNFLDERDIFLKVKIEIEIPRFDLAGLSFKVGVGQYNRLIVRDRSIFYLKTVTKIRRADSWSRESKTLVRTKIELIYF